MNNIRTNFKYNSILTTAGYLVPLITYPYASRVLGVANIGICNFVDSIIAYFVLFSMLGIGAIGTREIAKYKDERRRMSITFCNLVALNFIFSFLALLIMLVLIQIVPQFAEHKILMYIGVLRLLSNLTLIEWLFKGLEDFKFITIRSIIIKILYVVSVFLFVRKKEDYDIYFSLLIFAELMNAIINTIYARKYVDIIIKDLHPFKYLKSAVILGSYTMLTSMYTTFNVVFLGFATNTTEVGYYTTATKLHSVVIGFFSAFTGVMLPRMSRLLALGNKEEFVKKIEASLNILVYFSFPIIILGIFFSKEIVDIIAGSGYEGAIAPLMIVMPLVFIIGYEQILVIQVLMPLQKDKAILCNSVIGAIVGLLLNFIFVAQWKAVGSSLVWVSSELCVMISAVYFANKEISLSGVVPILVKNVTYSVPAIAICIIVNYIWKGGLLSFGISFILLLFYYVALHLFRLKDPVILSFLPTRISEHVK